MISNDIATGMPVNARPIARLTALLALCAATLASAADNDPLKTFSEDLDSFSATYEQVQTDEQGQVIQRSAGSMALERPGKFRWTYDTPYEQLMVCDGSTIWIYDPDLAQVTQRPAQAALGGTPVALLSQRSALADSFNVEELGDEDGLQALRLLPKSPDGDFKSIELWLMNGAPTRMRFHDTLGGQTEVRFNQIRLNPRLDASEFQFEPPDGVEIVEAG